MKAEIEVDRTPKPISLSVGLMLETKSGKLILVQQSNGQWGPIAGRIKEGESLEEAMFREAWEEACLSQKDIRDIQKWDLQYLFGQQKDKIGAVFQGVYEGPEHLIHMLQPRDKDEVVAVKAFSKEEVYDLILDPSKIYKYEHNGRNIIKWLLDKHQEEGVALEVSNHRSAQ